MKSESAERTRNVPNEGGGHGKLCGANKPSPFREGGRTFLGKKIIPKEEGGDIRDG